MLLVRRGDARAFGAPYDRHGRVLARRRSAARRGHRVEPGPVMVTLEEQRVTKPTGPVIMPFEP